jgi:hypothetical protein
MIRTCLLLLLLPTTNGIYGQLSSTATASTTATIIIPVGAEKSGDIISGSFYAGKKQGTVELTSVGVIVNGKMGATATGKETMIPSFHVLAADNIYSVTLSYDPVMINREKENETMPIESFTVIPVNEKGPGQTTPGSYSTGTIFRVGSSQSPGEYSSPHPYRVTVNFN